MARTADQEREEIRNGLDQVRKDSAEPIRQSFIAFAKGYPIPADTLANMVAIERRSRDLRVRDAVLAGGTGPILQPWLNGRAQLVEKSTIVDRLQAAGQLQAARTALDAASLYNRMRWDARSNFRTNDTQLIALLNAIGADPAVILAQE